VLDDMTAIMKAAAAAERLNIGQGGSDSFL